MDNRKRFGIQAVSALLHNANFKGFFTGKLYQGPLKAVCVPGLNCYSCPGSVGACPIGSLQSFLGGIRFRVPYYVVGLLLFFGARVASLGMELVFMFVTVELLNFSEAVCKLIAQVFILVANYIFSKLFIFRKKDDNA